MSDSLLDPVALPRFSALTPDAIRISLAVGLAEMESAVECVKANGQTAFAESWLPIERADNAINALWSAVSHLTGVADSAELRAVYFEGQNLLTQSQTRYMQDDGLFQVLDALAGSPEMAQAPDEDAAALSHYLRSCRLSGVTLPSAARARFAEISTELAALSFDFATTVLDATAAWSEHVTDPDVLAGLPEAALAMLAAEARGRDLEGWVVTLHQPSFEAIMTYAEDRLLRERVYRAYGIRASGQAPDAAQLDNSARMARIVELRHEAANLLGFRDPVERSLATKMAPSAEAVLDFLHELAARVRPRAEAELAALRAFAQAELGLAGLDPWDVPFASNRLKRAQLSYDEVAAKGYFPIDSVLAGWQSLLGRLFGMRLTERFDVELWHTDARFYEVADEDGTVFGGLYLDLHARSGKRAGAWAAQARPRLRGDEAGRLPIAYLTCNFAPASSERAPLLTHGDIVTLLHETGHCLHAICTTVDRPIVSGFNGVEWDVVELPSQLMEGFAWDASVLATMSGHYRTGEPIPAELLERLLAGRHFQSGMFVLKHVEYALFDLYLHLGTFGTDVMQVLEAVRDQVAVLRPPHWHRFPHSFTHVFAGGYAAGYYSYLWAEVLAADGFERFAEAGIVDRPTGDAFRAEILSRGGARSTADSFRAFRGRDAGPEAMLRMRGLVS